MGDPYCADRHWQSSAGQRRGQEQTALQKRYAHRLWRQQALLSGQLAAAGQDCRTVVAVT